MIAIQALYKIARLKPTSPESEQANAKYIRDMSEFMSTLPAMDLCKSIALDARPSIEISAIDVNRVPYHMSEDDIFANVNNGHGDERPYFICHKQGDI